MNRVGESLKRKLGPLPVWAWAIIGGGLLYWYRNRKGGSVSGTGTGSVQALPTQPQPQTTLAPGESVYDPNTGALSTAPGGGSGGLNGNDPSQAIDNLANAIADAINAGTLGAQQPGIASPTTPPPALPTSHRPPVGSPAGPHGAVIAGYGARPPKRKGFRIVGIGNGGWIAVPLTAKHTVKPKSANHQGASRQPVARHQNSAPGGGNRPRSNTAVRTPTGGRTAPKRTDRQYGQHPRSTRPENPPSRRTPQRTAVVGQPVVRQRPAASHPAPRAPRSSPHPAPRPSSPPPRTTRRPARRK